MHRQATRLRAQRNGFIIVSTMLILNINIYTRFFKSKLFSLLVSEKELANLKKIKADKGLEGVLTNGNYDKRENS